MLASQAEIGVWVKAPRVLAVLWWVLEPPPAERVRGYHPRKISRL